MTSIVADLIDLFPDTILVRRRTTGTAAQEGFGDEQYSATTESLQCRVRGIIKEVQDQQTGQVVKCSVKCVVAGAFGLTVLDEITLPVRFSPRKPRPIAVHQGTDESGAHHETVYF
jgi:hypothetical protein